VWQKLKNCKKHLLEYSEVKNVSDTAFEEGELSKAKKIAKNLLAIGLPIETIAQTTGLTVANIERLKDEIQGAE
jgi:hypothetical protein